MAGTGPITVTHGVSKRVTGYDVQSTGMRSTHGHGYITGYSMTGYDVRQRDLARAKCPMMMVAKRRRAKVGCGPRERARPVWGLLLHGRRDLAARRGGRSEPDRMGRVSRSRIKLLYHIT